MEREKKHVCETSTKGKEVLSTDTKIFSMRTDVRSIMMISTRSSELPISNPPDNIEKQTSCAETRKSVFLYWEMDRRQQKGNHPLLG